MNDIDFIKWMCDKADGFENHKNGYIDCGLNVSYQYHLIESSENWKTFFYPLLLQRAIEGVNRESVKVCDGWLVYINCADIDIYNYERREVKTFEHVSDYIDKSKESALRYIYEQEQKDEN